MTTNINNLKAKIEALEEISEEIDVLADQVGEAFEPLQKLIKICDKSGLTQATEDLSNLEDSLHSWIGELSEVSYDIVDATKVSRFRFC